MEERSRSSGQRSADSSDGSSLSSALSSSSLRLTVNSRPPSARAIRTLARSASATASATQLPTAATARRLLRDPIAVGSYLAEEGWVSRLQAKHRAVLEKKGEGEGAEGAEMGAWEQAAGRGGSEHPSIQIKRRMGGALADNFYGLLRATERELPETGEPLLGLVAPSYAARAMARRALHLNHQNRGRDEDDDENEARGITHSQANRLKGSGVEEDVSEEAHHRLFLPELILPPTITYNKGQAMAWYFSSAVDSSIKRKHSRNLNAAKIVACMSSVTVRTAWQSTRTTDVVATFYPSDSHLPPLYFDKEGVQRFVLDEARKHRSTGVLQKFVAPLTEYNSMIRATWTPAMCLVERRTSTYKLDATRIRKDERVQTYEVETGLGVEVREEVIHDTSSLRAIIMHACKRIAEHMAIVQGQTMATQQNRTSNSLTNMVQASKPLKMVLYLKLGPNNQLYLLLCDELKWSYVEGDEVEAEWKLKLKKMQAAAEKAKDRDATPQKSMSSTSPSGAATPAALSRTLSQSASFSASAASSPLQRSKSLARRNSREERADESSSSSLTSPLRASASASSLLPFAATPVKPVPSSPHPSLFLTPPSTSSSSSKSGHHRPRASGIYCGHCSVALDGSNSAIANLAALTTSSPPNSTPLPKPFVDLHTLLLYRLSLCQQLLPPGPTPDPLTQPTEYATLQAVRSDFFWNLVRPVVVPTYMEDEKEFKIHLFFLAQQQQQQQQYQAAAQAAAEGQVPQQPPQAFTFDFSVPPTLDHIGPSPSTQAAGRRGSFIKSNSSASGASSSSSSATPTVWEMRIFICKVCGNDIRASKKSWGKELPALLLTLCNAYISHQHIMELPPDPTSLPSPHAFTPTANNKHSRTMSYLQARMHIMAANAAAAGHPAPYSGGFLRSPNPSLRPPNGQGEQVADPFVEGWDEMGSYASGGAQATEAHKPQSQEQKEAEEEGTATEELDVSVLRRPRRLSELAPAERIRRLLEDAPVDEDEVATSHYQRMLHGIQAPSSTADMNAQDRARTLQRLKAERVERQKQQEEYEAKLREEEETRLHRALQQYRHKRFGHVQPKLYHSPSSRDRSPSPSAHVLPPRRVRPTHRSPHHRHQIESLTAGGESRHAWSEGDLASGSDYFSENEDEEDERYESVFQVEEGAEGEEEEEEEGEEEEEYAEESDDGQPPDDVKLTQQHEKILDKLAKLDPARARMLRAKSGGHSQADESAARAEEAEQVRRLHAQLLDWHDNQHRKAEKTRDRVQEVRESKSRPHARVLSRAVSTSALRPTSSSSSHASRPGSGLSHPRTSLDDFDLSLGSKGAVGSKLRSNPSALYLRNPAFGAVSRLPKRAASAGVRPRSSKGTEKRSTPAARSRVASAASIRSHTAHSTLSRFSSASRLDSFPPPYDHAAALARSATPYSKHTVRPELAGFVPASWEAQRRKSNSATVGPAQRRGTGSQSGAAVGTLLAALQNPAENDAYIQQLLAEYSTSPTASASPSPPPPADDDTTATAPSFVPHSLAVFASPSSVGVHPSSSSSTSRTLPPPNPSYKPPHAPRRHTGGPGLPQTRPGSAVHSRPASAVSGPVKSRPPSANGIFSEHRQAPQTGSAVAAARSRPGSAGIATPSISRGSRSGSSSALPRHSRPGSVAPVRSSSRPSSAFRSSRTSVSRGFDSDDYLYSEAAIEDGPLFDEVDEGDAQEGDALHRGAPLSWNEIARSPHTDHIIAQHEARLFG